MASISDSNIPIILWVIFALNVVVWSYLFVPALANFVLSLNQRLTKRFQIAKRQLAVAELSSHRNTEVFELFNENFDLASFQVSQLDFSSDDGAHRFSKAKVVSQKAPVLSMWAQFSSDAKPAPLEFIETSPQPISIQFSTQELCQQHGILLRTPLGKGLDYLVRSLDQIISNPKEENSTLILTNLDLDASSSRPATLYIETFYAGVDVATNFNQKLFSSKEDVLLMINKFKSKYREVILLAHPDEQWKFEYLPKHHRVAIALPAVSHADIL